ncbi:TetR/AcrR family transcriptional regulator [Nocardia sp. NPDC059246]|uniref:TetR/AcrR family transcriptional regulator n=1 Tax=unclassified Nocardia TaxID=2637762 RepID=UPI003685A0AB
MTAPKLAWGGDPPMDGAGARQRLVEAAARCLIRLGRARTSISVVAAEARVSRPTVYAHFSGREELIELAATHVSAGLFQHIVDEARHAPTAADFVVEATVAGARLLRETQRTALSSAGSADAEWLATLMTPESLRLARHYLEPIREYEPDLELDLDEIAETTIRFLISILQFDTPATSDSERLRGYLRRRLVPALGLKSRP